MPRLAPGAALYRNQDYEFEKTLSKKSAERKINTEFILEENNSGFTLTAIDEDDYSASIFVEFAKELSKKEQRTNQEEQLSKLGNTPFKLNRFSNRLQANWFIPSSLLSEMKRKTIEALLSVRKIAIRQPMKRIPVTHHPYPERTLTYLGNVSNEKAKEFYRQHGVNQTDSAFESESLSSVAVMTMKHCLKYQLGYCPRAKEKNLPLKEPLMLTSGKNRLTLRFDCVHCEMQVIA
jgi:putative protease